MDITIKLNEQDLDHFRRVMQQAMERNAGLSQAEICAHATELLERVRNTRVPDFVSDRMSHLVSLITMIQDPAWSLQDDERGRVLAALSYFAEPHDDIPDSVPVFGFLDDAVMIELVLRELHHELESYEEFHAYRAAEVARRGIEITEVGREEWLTSRRDELLDRMRRRRSGAYADVQPYSLFSTR